MLYEIIFAQRIDQRLKRKKTENKNLDAMLADQNIYHCSVCNRCWEKSKQTKKNLFIYYDSFVTYGKDKKQCPQCRDK
tara:strand:+ start:985 stop:1218 length:234 start_codon:yes stop_codon:yes gene_type:complete